jgi:hypothetical protein
LNYTDEEFLNIYNDIIHYTTNADVGSKLGRSKIWVKDRATKIRKNNPNIIVTRKHVASKNTGILSDDKLTIYKLSEENKFLKRAIDEAKSLVHTSSDIKNLIYEVKKSHLNTIPKWIDKENKGSDELVPVLFLTDIHLGEEVAHTDTGFDEIYNVEVSIESVNKLTEDFINICTHKMTNYKYPGCVLMLGGDGITGNLHDLSETNDITPVRQVIELTSLYIQQIKKLEAAFGKVAVFGVTGNHGRLDSHNYTKTKRRTENSLETITYHFVGEHFKDNKNVNIITDESDEILFGINGHKFLLTHGDRGIHGGNGIGGIIVPIKRARAKMLQAAVAMKKEFHTLVIGHFHTHHVSDELIIGNSVKPYDEYSKSMGFDYNTAGATSFFVNTHGEIIFATKLVVRDKNKVQKPEKSIELF